MYQDLREFITLVDKLGALRRIEGADPKFELGGITEVAAGLPDPPALLFERMQGCAPSFRVFTNATTTPANTQAVAAVGRKSCAVSGKLDAGQRSRSWQAPCPLLAPARWRSFHRFRLACRHARSR